MSETAPLMSSSGKPAEGITLRQRAFIFVEGDFDSWFEYSIMTLILLNVLAFIVGTVVIKGPDPCNGHCITLNDKYDSQLEIFEAFSVFVFTIEYTLRVWSCIEDPRWRQSGPILGRLKYMTSFFLVLDFFAIFPYYITLLPGVAADLDFTTALRLFRLVRLLKAEKYVNAFSLLGEVLGENSELLIACVYYSLLCNIVFGTALYYLERDNPLQSQYFRSIPESMWPTILMLTGEFPLADFTPWAKALTGFMAVTAVAIFAVPTGVIGSGFIKALERSKGKEFTVDA